MLPPSENKTYGELKTKRKRNRKKKQQMPSMDRIVLLPKEPDVNTLYNCPVDKIDMKVGSEQQVKKKGKAKNPVPSNSFMEDRIREQKSHEVAMILSRLSMRKDMEDADRRSKKPGK